MKNRRHYIVSFLFAAIILLPLLAITFLQIAQAYVKSNREERLQTEGQVQVVVPLEKLVWEEEGKELWIGNRMFDVASMSIIDGNCYLTGVYDNEETEVAGTLLHTLLNQDSKFLQLLLLLQYFTAGLLTVEFLTDYKRRKKQLSLYAFFLPNPSFVVLGPPPRF